MKYLSAFLLLILVSLGTAVADSLDTTIYTVPFDFVIGNKTFPAGTYTIGRISSDPREGLHMQSADGKINVFFRSTTSEAVSDEEPRLQFLHEGNMYLLAKIFGGSDAYTLAPQHHRQRPVDPAETVTVVTP